MTYPKQNELSLFSGSYVVVSGEVPFHATTLNIGYTYDIGLKFQSYPEKQETLYLYMYHSVYCWAYRENPAGLWLAYYRSYSVMAYSRTNSSHVGETKRFRHAVDSNGDRALSMFDVSTVELLELQWRRSLHR